MIGKYLCVMTEDALIQHYCLMLYGHILFVVLVSFSQFFSVLKYISSQYVLLLCALQFLVIGQINACWCLYLVGSLLNDCVFG